jgi:predicted MPP superfamily phosphohydrolase
MRSPAFLWIIAALMLLLDIYIYQAVKLVLPSNSPKVRLTLIVIYWAVATITMLFLLTFPYINYSVSSKHIRNYVFSLLVAAFLSKLIASLFFAADDLRRGATWLVVKLFRAQGSSPTTYAEGISRSAFLSWAGLAIGGGLFSTFIYGFTNKYNYTIHRHKIKFPNLPQSFRGLKIVQISDIHSGSFSNKAAVQKGVDKIMKEKPDLILFTGDLVNDRAVEMKDYMDVFGTLKAPMGIYSVLGNHDYGDYYEWKNAEEKSSNLNSVKDVHQQLGWKLMMNEHVIFERNNEQLALLGVENWSAKRNFPKHGKLSEAYPGTEKVPFKILMSHDPSHWDAEVRVKYPDIDLTLSGHTHGMQFGVEVPGIKWSPIQYMYKQWAGLYVEGPQKLYINRGFGFLVYPGRVGILPEITVLTLT